jgi:hypothetical protein
MKEILIVILLSNPGPAAYAKGITMQEFDNREACVWAGNQLFLRLNGLKEFTEHYCVSKVTGKEE